MQGIFFCVIIALCILADDVSAVATSGSPGSRASKNRRDTGCSSQRAPGRTPGDRGLPSGTTAKPVRARRKHHSQDDYYSMERGSSLVVGTVWEEEGLESNYHRGGGTRTRPRRRSEEKEKDGLEEQADVYDDDDYDNEQNDDYDDDDYDYDDDEEEEEEDWGVEVDDDDFGAGDASVEEEGDGSSGETDLSEEAEEEGSSGAIAKPRHGSRADGRRRTGSGSRAPTASAYNGRARTSSSSSSNRRAHHDYSDGSGRRGGSSGSSYASSSKKGKTKGGGVVKSVGKATGKSMKAMVHALQPKSVGLGEILDTWKIEQVIGKPPGRVTKCAATVEFRRDGTVATSFDGRESVSDFTFRAHAWPRACTIEFEAKAFQGPWDEEPVWKVYKGFFSRKLLDSKIIMLDGTIYDVTGKMMWKRRVRSGKFTARRRPSRLSRRGGGGRSSYYGKGGGDDDDEEEEEEVEVLAGRRRGGDARVTERARGERGGAGRDFEKRGSGSSRSRRSRPGSAH